MTIEVDGGRPKDRPKKGWLDDGDEFKDSRLHSDQANDRAK